MKLAAKQAKLRSPRIGPLLNVEPGAVRNWWAGINQPSMDMLQEYARVVGCSDYWLWTGEEDPRIVLAQLEEGLGRFWRFVIEEGMSLMDALDAADLSHLAMDEATMEALAETGGKLNQHLAATPQQEWASLTSEERAAVSRIVHLLSQPRD